METKERLVWTRIRAGHYTCVAAELEILRVDFLESDICDAYTAWTVCRLPNEDGSGLLASRRTLKEAKEIAETYRNWPA